MSEIWFVNHYAITPDLPGGTRHYDFGVELVKAGHKVRIFAADVNLSMRSHIRDLQGRLWLEEEVDGVLFNWIHTVSYKKNDWRRVFNMLNFSINLYRAGIRQNCRPDLVVGSSPHLFAALAAFYLARHYRCPFIFEVRDLWPKALVDMNGISPGHPMVRLMGLVEQKLYCEADHIVVLAQGSIPYIKEYGVDEKRISFIPNGVHPEHFRTRRAREEARAVFGFSGFTIVYTGAHGPANALDTVLEVAESLKVNERVEFVLVGDGPAKAGLMEKARKKGLPNLRFMAPVAKADIPDLLLAADAAVITLKDARAFYNAISPNKLFDYMAAGKPVLCAVPGEMASMVEESRCGFVSPPEDGKALAQNVKQMAGLPAADLEAMGASGQRLVMDRYSRPVLVQKLVEIISQVGTK